MRSKGLAGGSTIQLAGQLYALVLSGISLAILPAATRNALLQTLDVFRSEGGTVAYDSNHRPQLWESREEAQDVNNRMWALTDIALPSVDDEMAIFGAYRSDYTGRSNRKLYYAWFGCLMKSTLYFG